MYRLGPRHFEVPDMASKNHVFIGTDTQDCQQALGWCDASTGIALVLEGVNGFLVDKPLQYGDVRLILGSIHGDLVAQQIERIGDKDGQPASTSLE
jgi:hypothetical protein